MSKRLIGGIKGCKYKTSLWHLNGFPDGITLLGQQYNVREKPTVILYNNNNNNTTLLTDHGATMLLLLFLTFSVLVANPKKLLYTVANPARGLLNREKRTKEKVWQHTPPTPHTARSDKINKINKITRRIYRRYADGRSRVRTRIPSARRLGL